MTASSKKNMLYLLREKWRLGDLCSVNADLFSIFPQALKGNNAVNLGKNCIIPAQAHILPRMELGPSLPDNDASGVDFLPGIALDSSPLAVTVSAISGAAARFLM